MRKYQPRPMFAATTHSMQENSCCLQRCRQDTHHEELALTTSLFLLLVFYSEAGALSSEVFTEEKLIADCKLPILHVLVVIYDGLAIFGLFQLFVPVWSSRSLLIYMYGARLVRQRCVDTSVQSISSSIL